MKNKSILLSSLLILLSAPFCAAEVGSEVGAPLNVQIDNPKKPHTDNSQLLTLNSGDLKNTLITVDFKDTDISNVLRILSKQFNLNVIAGEDVTGKVTVRFKNVTLDGALSSILNVNGYDYILDGNVIRISKRSTLTAEREAKEQLQKYEELVTEVFILKFLDANDVKNLLFPESGTTQTVTSGTGATLYQSTGSNISLLSPRGKAKVLVRKGFKGFKFGAFTPSTSGGVGGTTSTVGGAGYAGGGTSTTQFSGPSIEKSGESGGKSNILLVQDVPSYIERVRKIINTIDTKPRQVRIDARIFEVNRNDMKDLGVEYSTGKDGLLSAAVTPTDLQEGKIVGGGVDRNFVLTGDDSFGTTGLQLQMQKINGNQFDVYIKALQKDADINELSAPRVVVLENMEATIFVGEAYPIVSTTVITGGVTAVPQLNLSFYQPIGIILQVIPMVNIDGNINMVIHPSISSISSYVTYSNPQTGTQTFPRLNIRETDTQVLIKEKETLVIGGLLQDRVKETIWGVPVLCKIPFLGHLFDRKKTEVIKVELVIFITPTIVKDYDFNEREKVIDGDVQEREKVLSRSWIEELKRQALEALK